MMLRSGRYGRFPGRKVRKGAIDRLLGLALVISLTCVAQPAARDLASQMTSQSIISRLASTTDETLDPRRVEILRQAQAYNMQLGGIDAHPDNDGLGGSNGGPEDILHPADNGLDCEVAAYERQLKWRDVDAICWLEIPSCGIVEPVYRGTAEETLAQGVGHLESSSLPVGGTSSNCVLAAHSGMERSRMFDDLGTLTQGDTIIIHTLGDAYWYEVYDIETVLPEAAVERCSIVTGEDLCTLLTCTPYGINSHRLLIHGRRVPTQAEVSHSRPNTATLVTRRTLPLAMVGAGFAPLATAGMMRKVRWRRRLTKARRRRGRRLTRWQG